MYASKWRGRKLHSTELCRDITKAGRCAVVDDSLEQLACIYGYIFMPISKVYLPITYVY